MNTDPSTAWKTQSPSPGTFRNTKYCDSLSLLALYRKDAGLRQMPVDGSNSNDRKSKGDDDDDDDDGGGGDDIDNDAANWKQSSNDI
jgi:hypothetical protein